MTEAGADIIVAHMGLTTGGAIGAETGEDARRMRAADRRHRRGRASASGATSSCSATAARSPMPDDAEYILRHCRRLPRLLWRSSMERLPTEIALTEQTRKFKALSF